MGISRTRNHLVKDYGGSVVELAPGTYRIERDPYAATIMRFTLMVKVYGPMR